jgi:hypothetical protein
MTKKEQAIEVLKGVITKKGDDHALELLNKEGLPKSITIFSEKYKPMFNNIFSDFCKINVSESECNNEKDVFLSWVGIVEI